MYYRFASTHDKTSLDKIYKGEEEDGRISRK